MKFAIQILVLCARVASGWPHNWPKHVAKYLCNIIKYVSSIGNGRNYIEENINP